ncbi:MAG: tRNA 2-thiouridine(34) synthase MnmA [Planctomycetota bacterium]|jgi:tRNA-specific 2-thiouridylase
MKNYTLQLVDSHTGPWQPANDVNKQIVVLMSGGVDSSVTAHLLREQGWDVVGVTMRIPVACKTDSRGCCGADAAYVCGQMKIPHYFVDVTEAFNEMVIERFRADYRRGFTPNPCVGCNTYLKFMLIWDLAEQELGVKHLATGHYAEVAEGHLRRGSNHAKDQSYFLYGIPRERLPYFHLPLAHLKKEEVRAIAANIGLGVADKPESMELCFAGEGDYRDALNQGETPGDLLDMTGNVIGTHKGIAHYTLGQRRGLGYAAGDPRYVARIDAERNTVTLGTRDEVHHAVVYADELNVLIPEQMQTGGELSGKLRSYGSPTQPCEILECSETDVAVRFDQKQFAPSPGQKLVLYNTADEVVAGGTIIGFE